MYPDLFSARFSSRFRSISHVFPKRSLVNEENLLTLAGPNHGRLDKLLVLNEMAKVAGGNMIFEGRLVGCEKLHNLNGSTLLLASHFSISSTSNLTRRPTFT